MSDHPPTLSRRLALAVGAAATATTIAKGVTAGSLLGWFRPAGPPELVPAAPAGPTEPTSPVIFVPVKPTPSPAPASGPDLDAEVQLAMHDDREDREDHEAHEDHEDHEDHGPHDHHEDDDD